MCRCWDFLKCGGKGEFTACSWVWSQKDTRHNELVYVFRNQLQCQQCDMLHYEGYEWKGSQAFSKTLILDTRDGVWWSHYRIPGWSKSTFFFILLLSHWIRHGAAYQPLWSKGFYKCWLKKPTNSSSVVKVTSVKQSVKGASSREHGGGAGDRARVGQAAADAWGEMAMMRTDTSHMRPPDNAGVPCGMSSSLLMHPPTHTRTCTHRHTER